ncbi:MAG: N-acetylneuraminate synthase family protein, partial [Spirochaetota bacterium]
LPLLRELGAYGLPTILSRGVSTLADIEMALSLTKGLERALLHCVTAYPAPVEDYNLRLPPSLSALFGIAVGVSDHSLNPTLVPALSVAMGASIVEKHICLSKEAGGLDDPIALIPGDFRRMKAAIIEASRQGAEATVRSLSDEYGAPLVEAILGSGVKRLAPSEAANYGRTNRSIHALREIGRGEILAASKLALLRTEKVLAPGLAPGCWQSIVGRIARRDIGSGQGIDWEDVGDFPDPENSGP